MDTENSRRLRRIDTARRAVCLRERCEQSREDMQKLQEIGADAVLIGETLMRAADKKARLARAVGGVYDKN